MKRKFGMADKLGYMFGDFGNDFAFILSSMFLFIFYTDVMGVSAAVVGTTMMAARLLDAFTDVTMGQIADRSRGNKKGKFAPWLLRMCGPVAVSSFLMYASWFAEMPMTFKIIWMFFTYLLWGSVFYTAINIPYGSMASAISSEPKDRTALSNWRTIGRACRYAYEHCSSLVCCRFSYLLSVVLFYGNGARKSRNNKAEILIYGTDWQSDSESCAHRNCGKCIAVTAFPVVVIQYGCIHLSELFR